jgi:hypothetical protein
LTPIEGKILSLTGPEILKSRPVDAFTVELNSLVNWIGSIDDAAYQAPKPPKARTTAKNMQLYLRVLFIEYSFYSHAGPKTKIPITNLNKLYLFCKELAVISVSNYSTPKT